MDIAHVDSTDAVFTSVLHALVCVLVQCVPRKPGKRFEFACRLRPGVSVVQVNREGFDVVVHKDTVTLATGNARANVRIREYR